MANAVVIMVLLGVLTAAALLAFNLLNLGKPPTLSIGFISTSQAETDLYLSSVEAAAADINHSVQNLSPQPPPVQITKGRQGQEAQHQFHELYSQGIRIFIVTSQETYQKLQNLEHFQHCTLVPLAVSEAENGPNLSLIQELRGYLALISHNNPSAKPLDIVTVWENREENSRLYDYIRQEVEANYTNLKLTLPVTYEASKYPRSDGVQAVAEISSRLVMHPTAHIFFLTSSRLNEVIATSKMNRDLSKEGRRWYARGVIEPPIDKEFYRKTSLTTLTFMAPDESRETLELLRRSIKDPQDRSPWMYLKAMAYATIYKLHKSFTEALISQRKMERLTSDRKPLAAALTYTGLMQIPLGEWAVTKIVETESYDVKDIPSHPLHRAELEKLAEPTSRKCANPFVQLWLHPSLLLPQVFVEFEDFKDLPELIVLPAQRGISVSLKCKGHLTSTKAHCVPSKFNQGDLTCSVSASPEIAASVKSKRSVDDSKKSLSISTIWQNFQEKVSPIWSAITPDVFACTTSIAGCDFCFYYLATYNLTAPPAACVGGCSLGTFGSCSKLVVSSLVKTLDLT